MFHEYEKEKAINFVDPERLEFGAWCHRTDLQVGQGDIAGSYSADRIGMGEPVRKPFPWKGGLWVKAGGRYFEGQQRIEAYRLVPINCFDGMPRSYSQITTNGEAARSNPMGFYHGMKVTHGGEDFVLHGKPEVFAPADTKQYSLL